MPTQGGPATRLTHHSNNESPYSFSPDGKAIYFGAVRQDDAANRQYPHRSQPELYTVPTGGRVDQIMSLPAEYVQSSQDGRTLIYHDKKGGENKYRKHHESAIARDIWTYDTQTKTHTQRTDYAGEARRTAKRSPT